LPKDEGEFPLSLTPSRQGREDWRERIAFNS